MKRYKEFIDKLRSELLKKLPGVSAQIQMAPEFREIKKLNPKQEGSAKKGSVLLLIYPKGEHIMVCFILRANDGGSHSGQIALPGGKYDNSDLSLYNTALRETTEEIGIDSKKVHLLGELTDIFIPISNFWVLPVVGYIDFTPTFIINYSEVQEIVEVCLNDLSHPRTRKEKKINIHNVLVKTPFYDANGHHIWGATAMIISEFLEILRRIKTVDFVEV